MKNKITDHLQYNNGKPSFTLNQNTRQALVHFSLTGTIKHLPSLFAYTN